MAATTCWRCLVRPPVNQNIALRSRIPTALTYPIGNTPFSTSTSLEIKRAPAPVVAKTKAPLRRSIGPIVKVFKKKKKSIDSSSKGRPPAPGERKALRKRIVLSNTNALEVQGMPELSIESVVDISLEGQVAGIPGPLVDQLRAIEAFRVSQAWGLFRRPGTLLRKGTFEYGHLFGRLNEAENAETVRRILVGQRGSGKSIMLLQAMSIAFLRDWVVIHIPEGMDIVNANTEYGPIPGTSPILYAQKTYTAALLSRISRANPILSTLQLSQEHHLPIPIQSNISLDRFALLGADDPDIAWPIFQALWTELTSPSRPKILLTLDNLAHVMRQSAYMSASFKPVHAHDLAIVKWFITYLSGASSLPNGGMVIAAVAESNQPTVATLRFKLDQIEARQNLGSSPALQSPIQPFLDATGQTYNPLPQPDPFVQYDTRVLEALDTEKSGLEVQRLEGLTKNEARGLMEYWAKSGIMRAIVTEGLVGEKWSIAGGGLVGELEKGCIRMRI